MRVFIYCLIDPRTNEIRYIGKTCSTLKERLRQHIGHSCGNRHKTAWLKQLKTAGLKPIIEALEVVSNSDDKDWQELERFWILYLRFVGCRLVNLDSGGVGGKQPNTETRQRMSQSGRLRAPASAEHRANLSRALAGRIVTPETRRKISEAHARPSVIARKREVHGGKPKSPEQRAKMSLAATGRVFNAETLAKMSASHIGKSRGPHKPETIEKLRIAAQARERRKRNEIFV